MIQFEGVTKLYPPDTAALQDVNLEIKEGEFVSIIGKSGAGKTTLLKLLLAEEKASQGRVLFEGKEVEEIGSSNLPYYRRSIGVVFQDYKLLDSKTVFENIAYVMEVVGAPDDAVKRDVQEVLDIVGISHKAESFPEQISDGERQRVAVARALIHRPKVILADEPTASLDPYNTRDIIRLLIKINEFGTTILLATHNREVINLLGKRVITLDDGRVARDEEKGRFVI
ncbi:MAG: cell division ATP-binding protein FtsE [Candidatus Wildermuthbacteria bacterium]|nr:cell division ATP-binding protein FtsE [Candidatus Wildermuthbacteria bacterium]